MAVVPFRRGGGTTEAVLVRPVVLVADAGPLAYLARADALDTLAQVGTRVELLDLVLGTALGSAGTEGAKRLDAWVRSGTRPHGPVHVRTTAAGRAASMAAMASLDQVHQAHAAVPGDDLPTLVAGWLALRLLDRSHPVLVLHALDCWAQLAMLLRDDQVRAMRLAAFLDLTAEQNVPPGPRRPGIAGHRTDTLPGG